MKLAYLLAQFLYSNKRLDLPGIGTFKLDPSIDIDTENSNKHRSAIPEGITYEGNTSITDSPELIAYISNKTGKMKALAIADLESHLELAQQFLNIGKPFTFEGIGSLVKVKPGQFEFTPGAFIPDKTRETTGSEAHGLSKKESVEAKYQAFLSTPARISRWNKPVMAILIIAGIGLAIWGGYTIATKNANKQVETASPEQNIETTTLVDTTSYAKKDTVAAVSTAPDTYKYVLQISQSKRAFDRYKQLKTNLWDVKMETTDSIQYKLFLLLPATVDTTRKLDSLMALTGKKVYIEHQN